MLDDPCSRNGGMDWDSLSASASPFQGQPSGRIGGRAPTANCILSADGGRIEVFLEKERNQKAQAEARLEAAESYRTEQDQLHEKHLTTLKEDHRKALEGLKESFKALSNDALKETHPAFLQLAKETFATLQESARGDLSKRQESIAALVKPLEDHLKQYQKQLSETEQHRSKSMGELKNQLEHLSSQNLTLSQETVQLRRILSSNQARGRWGEETLRRVVEAAGMSAHCDFVEQVQSGKPSRT